MRRVAFNFFAFPLYSPRVEIFPGLYYFPHAYAILVVTPSTNTLRLDTPPVYYTTNATYMKLPLRKYLRSVYIWKQLHILLGHPRNLCSMLKECSGRYSKWANQSRIISYSSTTFWLVCQSNVLIYIYGESIASTYQTLIGQPIKPQYKAWIN